MKPCDCVLILLTNVFFKYYITNIYRSQIFFDSICLQSLWFFDRIDLILKNIEVYLTQQCLDNISCNFMIKRQQISPWSFYNDFAATLPIDCEEKGTKKIKSQLLPKKRASSLVKNTHQQKQSQAKINNKLNFYRISAKKLSLYDYESPNLDSTNQSILDKQQQNHSDIEEVKNPLQTLIESRLIVHLILNELKQQKNTQSFLKLQQHKQRQICEQSLKTAQGLKLPVIERGRRCSEIVTYKFGQEMQRKPVQLNNELLQKVLRSKIKSMMSNKMKAVGTQKQILYHASKLK